MPVSHRKTAKLRDALMAVAKTRPEPASCLTKDQVRALHAQQRLSRFVSLNGCFSDSLELLGTNLALPREVDISAISPELVPVGAGSPESTLFSAAAMTWSVPVGQGFGRRMRFLVRDRATSRLMGLIGLTDPVFNLRARDNWVGWSADQRKKHLVHVMDAFVLGALPPYSLLLGGKLVALLATSRQVCRAFRRKYGRSTGIISGLAKDPKLALLTTTSALGRSSIYNRLRIPGGIEFISDVGDATKGGWFTQGYGHFHIGDALFADMVELLADRGHPYASANRFGDGPNWKIRVIRQAATELGLPADFLRHGVRRQVFVIPLAHNTRSFLRGKCKTLRYRTCSTSDITAYWCQRWALPRAERNPSWCQWEPGMLMRELQQFHDLAVSEG